jgi:hypothetical protein
VEREASDEETESSRHSSKQRKLNPDESIEQVDEDDFELFKNIQLGKFDVLKHNAI